MSSRAPETKVAVLGAAGFVGQYLLESLEARDSRATAIARGPKDLVVDHDFHVVSAPGENWVPGFDVVINLAFPAQGAPHEYPSANSAIFREIGGLLRPGGRLIQVSSLAVFGFGLERQTGVAEAAKQERDHPYIEAKLEAESAAVSLCKKSGSQLEIVRLGNVWGAKSGTWAVPLVQKLLTGRPVAVTGSPGFSNATDVHNVAEYLADAALQSAGESHATYTHLAEFAEIPWTNFAADVAAHLGVEPEFIDAAELSFPVSTGDEFSAVLQPLRARAMYRRVAPEPKLGSWSRSAIRLMPERLQDRLKNPGIVFAEPARLSIGEELYLHVIRGERKFTPNLPQEFTPALGYEESIERVVRWIDG